MYFLQVLLALLLFPICAKAQSNLIERIQNVQPSLVGVKTVYAKVLHAPSAGDKMVTYERWGTGLVIDPAGLVVTNTHIIINAPHIFVVFSDGTQLPAEVAYVNTGHDFSFLKVAPSRALNPVQWADSSQAQLGQAVVAMGNSDLNNQSILSGEVTRLLQSQSTGAVEFIEVNLNLYRGDSGGPILDHTGRLLGMIMAKNKSEERAGLAIASDRIREQYLIYKRNHSS